jgi:hypothetical protein
MGEAVGTSLSTCGSDLVFRDRSMAVKVLMDKRRTGRRQGQSRSAWDVEPCACCRGWHIYPQAALRGEGQA